MTSLTWPNISNDALVERLIPAIQQAIVGAADQEAATADDLTMVHAPDVANALLMILATLLEQSPGCSTPRGIRLVAEAAGKELAQLVRETRGLRAAATH